jgi:hypothetical protein
MLAARNPPAGHGGGSGEGIRVGGGEKESRSPRGAGARTGRRTGVPTRSDDALRCKPGRSRNSYRNQSA